MKVFRIIMIVASLMLCFGQLCDAQTTYSKKLKKAARHYPYAQEDLGLCYEQGLGVKQNYEKAVKWYTKAALRGYGPAQIDLANCYLWGNGVKQNYDQALEWYTKAAAKGYTTEIKELGDRFFHGDKNVEKNYEEAAKWYTLAAENGDGQAAEKLSWLYMVGWGVEKDNLESLKWYEKSLSKNKKYLSRFRALDYMSNEDDDSDIVKYVKEAAENENDYYLLALGDHYAENGNYEEAVKWYTKSAEQGFLLAYNNLGDCYRFGKGVEQDYGKAFDWFQKAATAKYPLDEAMLNLAKCYYNGDGVERDYNTAFDWFLKAATAEYPSNEAMLYLAKCYYNGEVVARDYTVAFGWFQKAATAKRPSSEAMLYLAKCYANGYGVERDPEQADYWMQQAAECKNDEATELLELQSRLSAFE